MALTIAQLQKIAGRHATRAESEVKSDWRSVVEEAREHDLIVTSGNRPVAVVVSAERYAELCVAARGNDPSPRLEVLQGPVGARKLAEVFNATPRQLADAANKARRRK